VKFARGRGFRPAAHRRARNFEPEVSVISAEGVSLSVEATMALHARRSTIGRSTFFGIGLFAVSAGLAWPQQSAPPQRPLERHDPATSGAGPTSGAPGLHENNPPKGSSVTIDSSGVATVKPIQQPDQTNPPLNRGNENADSAPPK
jgi:hypothetical protein